MESVLECTRTRNSGIYFAPTLPNTGEKFGTSASGRSRLHERVRTMGKILKNRLEWRVSVVYWDHPPEFGTGSKKMGEFLLPPATCRTLCKEACMECSLCFSTVEYIIHGGRINLGSVSPVMSTRCRAQRAVSSDTPRAVHVHPFFNGSWR